MLSIRKKGRLFFETFDGMASSAVEAARLLGELFRNGPDGHAGYAGQIKTIEHHCDELVHTLIRTLNQTFITPFDREDIHDLGSSMDDIVDRIDAAASHSLLYKVGGDVPDAAALAGVILKQAEEVRQAVENLRDSDKVLDRCRRINALEKEGDRLYRNAMVRLFESGRDAIFVIKAKEIIETLEAATDAGDHIAIVLERIVLKNQ